MFKKKIITAGLAVALTMAPTMTAFAAPVDRAPGDPVPATQPSNSVIKAANLSKADRALLQKLFDANFFAKKYPAIAKALANDPNALFNYFCTFGIFEGKQCNANFDVAAYACAYQDLASSFGTDIMKYYSHYIQYGQNEGRALTTVSACKMAGLDTRAMESQRFMLNAEGEPVFSSFFNPVTGTFVYNETEAKAVIPGATSDNPAINMPTVSTEVVGSTSSSSDDEPSYTPSNDSEPNPTPSITPGFNQTLYESDMAEWESRRPDIAEYLEDDVYDAFMEAYAEWEASTPCAEDFVVGKTYATQEAAEAAFEAEKTAWESAAPDVEDYMTEEQSALYTAEFGAWSAGYPTIEDPKYAVNTYASEIAANNAYNDAIATWKSENGAPVDGEGDYRVTAYDSEEEANAVFTSARDEWLAKKPVATETASAVYTSDGTTPCTEEEYDAACDAWNTLYDEAGNPEEGSDAYAEFISSNPLPTYTPAEYTYQIWSDDSNALVDCDFSDYHDALESYPDEPVLGEGEFTYGTTYRTEEDAHEAFTAAYGIWEEANSSTKPDETSYVYDSNKFATEEARDAQFDIDKADYERTMPLATSFADMTEYQAAYDAWEAKNPENHPEYYKVLEEGESLSVAISGDSVDVVLMENVKLIVTDDGVVRAEYDDRVEGVTAENVLNAATEAHMSDEPHLAPENWKEGGHDQYIAAVDEHQSYRPNPDDYENGGTGTPEKSPEFHYTAPGSEDEEEAIPPEIGDGEEGDEGIVSTDPSGDEGDEGDESSTPEGGDGE